MIEAKNKAEEEKRKQEAIENERLALLEKIQNQEEQKKIEQQAKKQLEMTQLESLKLESITPSTLLYDTNEKQDKVLIDKGPITREREVVKTTEEQERVLKENERNSAAQEARVNDYGTSHVQQQAGVENNEDGTSNLQQQASVVNNSPISKTDPSVPPSPISEMKNSDRTSARTERENRRQRCLMHDMLQNKHLPTSLVEAEKGEECGRTEEQLLQTGRELEVVLVPQEEKSDKEKEVTAKMAEKTIPNQPAGKPARPLNLQLSCQQSSEKKLSEDKNVLPTLQDVDIPSVGIIQRYSDHEKLKNKAEKWKEKRLNESNVIEAASTPEKDERNLPQDTKELLSRGKCIASTTQASVDMRSPSTPQSPPMATDKEQKTNLQKKKSFEYKLHPDTTSTQSTDKHNYKNPLQRLLGKKPDKKSSKDGPLTPEGTEQVYFPHPAQEPLATKRSLDGATVTGQTVRPSPIEPASKVRRNRSIKIGKATTVTETSLRGAITDSTELKHLDDFLFAKINTLHQDKSDIEALLYKATEMFRENLKSMYSSPKGHIHVGYKDLMDYFQLLVNNLNREKNEKDVKLVLNLFQSFLDEFTRGYAKREDHEPHKLRKSQKKKRKQDQHVESQGHVFISYQVTIGQSCEHCSSTIWPMEKAFLCSACKMISHKKCMSKIQSRCAPLGVKRNQGNHHFGVHVADLTNETTSVPIVMEILLEYLEMHGLYTEGIYRKSGAANCMRELKMALEKDPTSVKLDKYAIHAITGILKQWLRELPEPLMTFAQYSEFLKAVELPEKLEQLCTIYKVLGQLPQANYNSLERLIFHLVKVALQEDVNRMSPNSLAIVFAPCLLRCPDNYDPLTSMKEVSKATACVEMLIKEQLRQYKIKMQEIGILEAAESRAVCRLSLLRKSTAWPDHLGFISPIDGCLNKSPSPSGNGVPNLKAVQEEQLTDSDVARESEFLIQKILTIKDEKDDITYRLPDLDQRGSDEENMDSETSNSTESLLDDRPVHLEKEATCAAGSTIKSQPEENPISLPVKGPLFTLSVPTTAVKRRPSSFLAKMRGPRRNPVMPNTNIKLPHGVTKAVDYTDESNPVRRREQPGRRTDSIQSVYIPEGTVLGISQGTTEYEPTAKLKRRFSDPHLQIPCSEESNL